MKKNFLLVAFIALSTLVNAYEVGDWFFDPQTGIPSVVVFVDQTGEHGLIMSPAGGYSTEKSIARDIKDIKSHKKTYSKIDLRDEKAIMSKYKIDITPVEGYKNQADELFDVVMEWLPSMPLMYASKINEKQEREMLRKVAPMMTGYGAQDQQMIIEYCEENGVSLPVYFSSIDWALKLGDGWFIPGNYELELFASSISSGLGVRMSEKERWEKGMKFRYKTWMLYNVYPTTVRSSTSTESLWEEFDNNKGKTAKLVPMGGTIDFNSKDNYYVFEYGNGGYFLIRNNLAWGNIVAFKYF